MEVNVYVPEYIIILFLYLLLPQVYLLNISWNVLFLLGFLIQLEINVSIVWHNLISFFPIQITKNFILNWQLCASHQPPTPALVWRVPMFQNCVCSHWCDSISVPAPHLLNYYSLIISNNVWRANLLFLCLCSSFSQISVLSYKF